MGTISVFGHIVAIDLFLFLVSTPLWAGIAIRMAGGKASGIRAVLVTILAFGVLSARAVHILVHRDGYRAAPWRALALGDGGFIVFAGFLAAALTTLWFGWRRRPLLRPLVTALVGGLFAWSIGLQLLWLVRSDKPGLPEVSLSTLDGHPIAIRDFSGRPLVVNLWATWCAPCRRELPVLRDAQLAEKDVIFVFADQVEAADTIRAYLDHQHLSLRNVLMDPLASLAVHAGTSAVPTTLFFDEKGMLVKKHAGALSAMELRRYLDVLHSSAKADIAP
ncbi:TlpA disulfide reductase family protein [Noviherbaspirillum pedocola]|uniref:Redoxin family protein n=1 Tax=Noviherbaspirillum pedocola TaxID=2801341 RepID=A0A934T068_9BURK|nr:TlpA disulfide reductase family protein [Noviherbaspirillum pedocola]MBK4734963.1 redoxin family protein [Noviherbaspirillum pedocola]